MFDRQLVACAVQRHLSALKLPLRPVIFNPNFGAAKDQVDKLTLVHVPDAKSYLAAMLATAKSASWDVPWAAWDVAWVGVIEAGIVAGELAWSSVSDTEALDARVRFRSTSAVLEPVHPSIAWAAMMGITWDAAGRNSLLDSPPDGYPFIKAAQTFLEVLRGGVLFLWIAPEAVHVVLATIRTHEWAPVHPGWENRLCLHCEDAPAIEYEDGSGLYYWRGIQVSERMILCPGEMRVEEILQQRNAEVRRAMIERYGQDRFFLNANAQQIDKWKDNELLSIDLPDDRDGRMVALKLRCPSTSAVYIIRVPPDQRTVQGALAWSFGLGPGEYVLQEES